MLKGWQQIAAYLGHPAAVVQRWASEGMPVRRQVRFVTTTPEELNAWLGIGKWRVDELTPEGKIVRVQKKLKLGTMQELPTKAAPRDALRQLMGAQEKPQAPSIEFTELVDRWLATVGPTLPDSTWTHCENSLKRIKPHFQRVRVRDLDRYTVERLLLSQSLKYSRSTLRSFRTSLSLVLSWAEANGWVPKNPVRGVMLPRECGGKQLTRHALATVDVNKLVAAFEEPYATLCLLLHVTGLRISEALGLRLAGPGWQLDHGAAAVV
jgi:hypothetical protein